jgi:3-dehydroquinate synthetase
LTEAVEADGAPTAPHIELHCAPPGFAPTRIRIGVGVAESPSAFASLCAPTSVALVDGGALDERPDLAPLELPLHVVDGGEACKTIEHLERVLRVLATHGVTRDGVLCVVGGGAVGDLGGLAAALWLRGIAHVQVPTTLLAMIDSSVGGKTAIDLPEGKNLVGAFWPAREVYVDPGFLRTLPRREIRSGIGEALKIAIGLDAELFAAFEARVGQTDAGDVDPGEAATANALDPRLDAGWATTLVERCIRNKIDVVERDPTETGPRRLLNLGHTIGHALEAVSSYRRAHGIAVARGLFPIVRLARDRGLLAPDDAERITRLVRSCGFAEKNRPPFEDLEPFVRRDKKALAGGATLRAVLPTGIGSSEVVEVGLDELRAAYESSG